MKKALALVLAVAMIASMAVASFAAVGALVANTTTPTTAGAVANVMGLYKYDAKTDKLTGADAVSKYGTTLYVRLLDAGLAAITNEKSVSGLKVSATWTEGAAYVSGVEIVKTKVAELDGNPVDANWYLVAISTTGASLDNVDVAGTVYLKGKSGSVKTDANYKVDAKFSVDFVLGYPTTDNTIADGVVVDEDKATVYDFTAQTGDAAEEFDIVFDKFVVTANVKNEKKVVLAVDNTVIDEVDEAYPEANIDYYALTGAFKKTAKVVVELEDGKEFLYAVVDGQVVEVDGEYDDWAEEFTFKTKNLGTYIISDVELELAEEVVVANPSTGAAA